MDKPDLSSKTMNLDVSYVNQLLGLELASSEICRLLEKMRLGAAEKEDFIEVSIPSYRNDILHPIDLVEDVAIAYGYMNFEPKAPEISTFGSTHPDELLAEKARDILVGLGSERL